MAKLNKSTLTAEERREYVEQVRNAVLTGNASGLAGEQLETVALFSTCFNLIHEAKTDFLDEWESIDDVGSGLADVETRPDVQQLRANLLRLAYVESWVTALLFGQSHATQTFIEYSRRETAGKQLSQSEVFLRLCVKAFWRALMLDGGGDIDAFGGKVARGKYSQDSALQVVVDHLNAYANRSETVAGIKSQLIKDEVSKAELTDFGQKIWTTYQRYVINPNVEALIVRFQFDVWLHTGQITSVQALESLGPLADPSSN